MINTKAANMQKTNKDKAIAILIENGWVPDGRTSEETFRMGTTSSPILGGIGGNLVTTGGRIRYKKGDWKVTVGTRTTYFWNVAGYGSAHIKTSQIDQVLEEAAKVK